MITEHLMRLGGGSVTLRPELPIQTGNDVLALVDENGGGPGAHIVITPAWMQPGEYSDTAILEAATFAGPITKRTNRLTLQFDGMSAWLDSYIESAVTFTAATPTTVLTTLLTNGLTVGAVSGGNNISRTFPAYSATRRDILDSCGSSGGWEYRINADGTVDAGTSVFRNTPEVIVRKDSVGVSGTLRGVDGGIVDQSIDVSQLATKAVSLTQGEGAAIASGSATQSLNLKTRSGGTPELVTVIDAPSESSSNATSLATNYLNLRTMRRKISVTSTSHNLPLHAKPGDYLYVYDLPESLLDLSTGIVETGGESITPVLVRLVEYTRPIEAGSGVLVRSNAASPVYTDLTPWVQWETGETSWTVGTWNPTYGRVNRANPEIEDRVT